MGVDFGEKIKISVFGESHSDVIGTVMTGMPQGWIFDAEELREFMERRTPDSSMSSTSRREPDTVEFTEGINAKGSQCRINGDRIVAVIRNRDVRSSDYDDLYGLLRPGHADLGAFLKYGIDGLKPGGGRFSGRMTAPLCIAGGISKQFLEQRGIYVNASVTEIGGETEDAAISAALEDAASEGDSLGGVIRCSVRGFPGGTGGPLFEGLEGRLAQAEFAIPAVKGIEFGSGFRGSRLTGRANNDEYRMENGRIVSVSNNHGGITGGISTGMDIEFSVAVKPTPSIQIPQKTVNVVDMTDSMVCVKGRHDVCIVPRAVPVVEAMAAFVLFDCLCADAEE